jgi:hypothetical protein
MKDSSGRPAYGEHLGRPRFLGYTGATGTSPMCRQEEGRIEICRYLDTYASAALAPHQSKHQLDKAVLRLPRSFA